ncbi:MAG: sulfite exporter TauE/SafE family protein [Anaerolineae bacterium]|nr:sulfite exporter TauE/SafE family protein [Anaerolineae bacterium]
MTKSRSTFAFGIAIPIGILGGLIGLGGAEFRLPVLAGPLRYTSKQAVPLNLAVSLITVTTSLLIRSRTLKLEQVEPLSIPILALILGAMIAAFGGTALAARLSENRLKQAILVLLLAIGTALIIEGFLPESGSGLAPETLIWQVSLGILFGLLIGLVSSLLGVAGGELIIPTLIFIYGAGVKAAGTASLMISLPTIIVGLIRYARQGAFASRTALRETILPMGIGSVIGAVIGGILAGVVPADILKIGLGMILIVSAFRVFGHVHSSA